MPRAALLFFALLAPAPAAAQEVMRDVGEPPGEVRPEVFHTPYAFADESWGLALGYGVIATGQVQDQLSTFATAAASGNGTAEGLVGFAGLQLPRSERWFLDAFALAGTYSELRAYAGLDADGERSGTNDSDPDNFVHDDALQGWSEARLRFVLPIGAGKEAPIQRYTLDRGLLVGEGTGGEVWNPLTSGRTYLGLTPFYRRQEYDRAEEKGRLATNGLALQLWYDNTDFPRNPSRGSTQGVRVWRDFGGLDSNGAWTVIEGRATKYLDLGATGWARQQVLAFGAWGASSTTWEDAGEGARTGGAPPYYMGATLGGQDRLRAYPANRFNDHSALHYWLEYRMVPGWQPLPRIEEIRRAEVDWWQWALFAEAGRVGPDWHLPTLHEDMQWDAGLSLRIFARKALVRLDLAAGPEGWQLVVDLRQPF